MRRLAAAPTPLPTRARATARSTSVGTARNGGRVIRFQRPLWVESGRRGLQQNPDNDTAPDTDKLAVMYAAAESKIEAAAKKKKASNQDAALLARFKGELPPSLLRVLAGEIAAPNTGFRKIALQAAITANAVGLTEDQLLVLSAGVIEKHQSDGHRYNTPAKRRSG
jgi:hypothetical protein